MGLNDMDIVEFVEKVCEFSLTDFQKEFVRKAYDCAKKIISDCITFHLVVIRNLVLNYYMQ